MTPQEIILDNASLIIFNDKKKYLKTLKQIYGVKINYNSMFLWRGIKLVYAPYSFEEQTVIKLN